MTYITNRTALSNRASKLSSKLGLSVAIAALAPVVPAAIAQDAPDEETESRQEVVIVSATKRDESIQDVAASITQLGEDELIERGLNDLEGLTSQVPNLSWGRYLNSTFVTIRGVGTTVDSGIAEPAVALYVDGVFLPRSTMATVQQVDLARVEALRGPQGTLYGRNATGGALNFISQKPTKEFEAGFTATLEERSGQGLNGYISGPVTDKIALRLSGGVRQQDGYVDVINTGDAVGGTDLYHGRLAANIELTESATLDLSVQHEKNEDDFIWISVSTPPVGVLGFYAGFAPDQAVNFTTEPNQTYAESENEGRLETTIASATLNWDLSDNLSFRSVTGFVDHSSAASQDSDATDITFVNITDTLVTSESISQEFNLIGETGQLNWLLGAYYFEEEHNITGDAAFDTLALTLGAGVPFDPSLLPLLGVPTVFNFTNFDEATETYAVFADMTYNVTDDLRILAGARLNSEKKEFNFFGAPSPSGNIDTDDFLPKLGLQYDVNDNVMVYGQWQKGVKSGGHQLTTPELFGGEEVEAFEVGLKSRTSDGRLTFNTAAFLYDYADLQADITIPPTTAKIENGDAEIFGFEAELFYAPTENFNLNVGISHLDSEYTELFSSDQTIQPAPVVDLAGEDIIRAPKFTLNAGAGWTIPFNNGPLGSLSLRGDVFHTDSFKLALIDRPETRQGAYTTVNLSATLTDSSGRYSLRGFVRNATDEIYLTSANYLATIGAFQSIHAQPRTAGVSLSAKF